MSAPKPLSPMAREILFALHHGEAVGDPECTVYPIANAVAGRALEARGYVTRVDEHFFRFTDAGRAAARELVASGFRVLTVGDLKARGWRIEGKECIDPTPRHSRGQGSRCSIVRALQRENMRDSYAPLATRSRLEEGVEVEVLLSDEHRVTVEPRDLGQGQEVRIFDRRSLESFTLPKRVARDLGEALIRASAIVAQGPKQRPKRNGRRRLAEKERGAARSTRDGAA